MIILYIFCVIYPVADIFDGGHSSDLVVGAPPSEVHKHVVQDPLLEGGHVTVHVIGLAPPKLVGIV